MGDHQISLLGGILPWKAMQCDWLELAGAGICWILAIPAWMAVLFPFLQDAALHALTLRQRLLVLGSLQTSVPFLSPSEV